jgi:hypothetical protein
VGRNDQRHHDALRRVAQAARRPDPQVPDRLAVVLRHVDLRCRTTPTGRSATFTRARSAGSA